MNEEEQTEEVIDDSTATSKITITISGVFFNNDKSQSFVKADWFCKGEPINEVDLYNIMNAGFKDMLTHNQKHNPEINKGDDSPLT